MTNSDKDSEERKKYQRTPNLFGDCEHITTMVVRLSRETEKFARYTICNQMVSQCFLLETNVRRAYRERDMDAKHRYIRYAMDAYEEIMSRQRQLIFSHSWSPTRAASLLEGLVKVGRQLGGWAKSTSRERI